jgi:hypothetical protein
MVKKSSKIYVSSIIIFIALTIIACSIKVKKYDLDYYIDNNFTGEDPWKHKFDIDFIEVKDDKITWTFTIVIVEGENTATLTNTYSNDFKDNKFNFDINGIALEKESVLFMFKGIISLENGEVVVNFEDGLITDTKSNDAFKKYHVSDLDASSKSVTLSIDE